MADFEKNHPGIAEQELWKLFLRKAEEQGLDRDFISAVGKVCAIGLNLSKYIVRFFPTFTLHDETHSANVCRWMWVLLGEKREQVTAHEAALLLMAACCHDIGMAVSPEQEEQMRLRTYPGWDEYFRQNLRDDEEYEKTKVISDRMLRNFVRMHHHERIEENLLQSDWPGILNRKGINRDTFLILCRSHGTELSRLELRSEPKFDLLLCAVLLRLADLLDYDTSRAPAVLFRHMGLDRPANAEEKRSAVEYGNNQAGTFDETIVNDVISYYAEYDNPQQEQEVQGYLDWVTQELKHCAEELAQTGSAWGSLRLPYRINTDGVTRNGYAAGKFCMTMDQDKVIDLLTGENLYSDAGVFVRELLQNSIDAVLMRAKQDTNFNLEDGLIQIDTWMDEEANTWFRIRDNGTGMNEHIIQNHFLKVGNSYYTSEEFQYANRHAPKGSYTAISRFGIGILSCFMGDKEHTQLKVSTKRFDEKGKSGIRLDVTGLHGYYFLCKEKKHPESEPWFPKMPSLNEKDRGYRTEPGTTICVNTNLLRMGELRSFREILDEYVLFPEVRVTYNGQEGRKEYETQQEMMDAVHALNPGGAVKEYVHEFTNEWMSLFPNIIWDERPKVVLRFTPMDFLSDTEKLTGAALSIRIDHPKWKLRFKGRGKDEKDLIRRLLLVTNGMLSREEKTAIRKLRVLQDEQTLYAYNGVLASRNKSVPNEVKKQEFFSAVILLRKSFRPEVNLERNEMGLNDPEASCCMAIAEAKLHEVLSLADTDCPLHRMYTERELWDVLDRHPGWNGELQGERWIYTWGSIPFMQVLEIAANKRTHALYVDFGRNICSGNICISQEPPDNETADFPAAMFFWPEQENSPLTAGGNMYNRKHPFSLWLIRNRTAMQEQAPVLYDLIIRTMMLKDDPDEICRILNDTWYALRSYPGNPFRVPEDLILTKEDFGK